MNAAIVVGSRGQDGRILGAKLASAGVRVIGVARQVLDIDGKVAGDPIDITDSDAVAGLVAEHQPDAVYYLAARHSSSEEGGEAGPIEESFAVQVYGLANFLGAIAELAPSARLVYASSSHVFGSPEKSPQNEETPLRPVGIYGISKQAGMSLCRAYRETRRIHASVAILYNHESEYRSPRFVSQKIIRGALEILSGREETLVLGDLSAVVDWGYAGDHVRAMMQIADLDTPDDFVVATGEPHAVGEFVDHVFALAGLDRTRHVREDPNLVSSRRIPLIGDAAKLRRATGWSPRVGFEEMIARLWEHAGKGFEHGPE